MIKWRGLRDDFRTMDWEETKINFDKCLLKNRS